jgi:tryptophan 2,3-dioxygenase
MDTPTTPAYGARLDFDGDMAYGDYLAIEQLLSAQHPLSPDHNEMLFIIQHQTSELWMKLMIHELRAAREQIMVDQLSPAFKMMARVGRIMDQLVHSWDVLSTLTPSEYSAIRPYLRSASGFQSHQYRIIEYLLGNKQAVMMRPHRHKPAIYAEIAAELARPSLYDEAIRLLARRGHTIDPQALERDWTGEYVFNPSVEAAWIAVYANPNAHWDLYELAEELVDLEDTFRQWRFRHLTTVERIIGLKRGTGGTPGASYLRQVLEVQLFPELWRVRTGL